MTNFDPGGFLMLLTVIPAVAAGVISVGVAQVSARLGYGEYETNVTVVLAILVIGWIVASFLFTTSMLQILAVILAMIGAFAVTRSVTASSYGWVIGVVLLFGAFTALTVLGIYQGVDQTGRPQGLIARHLRVFYYAGLFVSGAIGGKAAQLFRRQPRHN